MNSQPFNYLILVAIALNAISISVSAQSSASQQDPEYPETVKQYLRALYSEQQQKYTYRSDYPGGLRMWQAEARPELRRLIGLDNIAAYVSTFKPKVRLLEEKDRGSHTLQRGIIETEPHVEIPFWLLRPKSRGPFPLAILPHGHDRTGHDTHAAVFHSEEHQQRTIAGDRDVAVQAVENGFLAIAPAVRGLSGEAPGVPDILKRHGKSDCRSQLMHCLLAGRTAIGERVWDMSRIIDWAITRSDVDACTILMMGNSGGGMVTLYAAACDERITLAVPSCSFSVIASPEGRIYHCDCNAIPGILQWGNLYDVAGLIAPRYLLTVNGLKDRLHSVDDINRAANRVQAIYHAAGVPEHYDQRWGPEGHRFYKNLMWPFIKEALEKK